MEMGSNNGSPHLKSKKLENKSKKEIFDLIVEKVKLGRSPYEIEMDKRHLSYYINILKRKGFISKIGYGVWAVDKEVKTSELVKKSNKSKKSSIGTRGETNVHALNINIPIISGSLDLVKDFNGYAQKQFNNWIPQYKKVIVPIGFTLKNNNNKSIDVQIWSRKIVEITEITSVTIRTLYFVQGLLKDHVNLDILAAKTKTLHVIVKEKELEKVMNKGMKITIPLGRKTAKILDNDDQSDALVWTDASPFRGIESNDVDYVKNYILMPEKVNRIESDLAQLAESTRYLAENINLHIPAIVKLGENAEKLGNNVELQTSMLEKLKDILTELKDKK